MGDHRITDQHPTRIRIAVVEAHRDIDGIFKATVMDRRVERDKKKVKRKGTLPFLSSSCLPRPAHRPIAENSIREFLQLGNKPLRTAGQPFFNIAPD